ncbi:MAG: class I SAM-dependent methyltransferase [Agriterribacter sp.]
MEISEAVYLISTAIDSTVSQTWADLGCGSGTFTYALAECLPAGSSIYAVDAVQQKLSASRNNISIIFQKADFEKDILPLPLLDGIMMANALHYIKDKTAFMEKAAQYFAGNKKLLIVEYDTTSANRWVPFPVNFSNLKMLLQKSGFTRIEKQGERNSAYGGKMYAALAV